MVRRRDYTSVPVRARRLWILVCALALAVGLGACGQEADPSTADNEGVYIDAGPITYQVQISRELNPYKVEDRQYLAGLPAGTGHADPRPGVVRRVPVGQEPDERAHVHVG